MNKIIPIDIYNTDVMVHFGSQDTLKEELSLVYGLEGALSILKGMDIDETAIGRTVLTNTGTIILWMLDIPKTSKEKGTMVHEIFHATCLLMNKIDVPPSSDNEEAYAYLIGYITSKVEDLLTSAYACDVLQQ